MGEVFFEAAGGKIDIYQGIEFVEDDVDVIGADAGGDDGEAFLADAAGVGHEFPVLGAVFDRVEMPANAVYTVGIANGDNGRGQFFGSEIEVVDSAAFIDNEFAFRD